MLETRTSVTEARTGVSEARTGLTEARIGALETITGVSDASQESEARTGFWRRDQACRRFGPKASWNTRTHEKSVAILAQAWLMLIATYLLLNAVVTIAINDERSL